MHHDPELTGAGGWVVGVATTVGAAGGGGGAAAVGAAEALVAVDPLADAVFAGAADPELAVAGAAPSTCTYRVLTMICCGGAVTGVNLRITNPSFGGSGIVARGPT